MAGDARFSVPRSGSPPGVYKYQQIQEETNSHGTFCTGSLRERGCEAREVNQLLDSTNWSLIY